MCEMSKHELFPDELNEKKEETKPPNMIAQAMSFFSQFAIIVIVCVFIGVFLGRFLDGLLGTSPWLLLICSFLGAGASFRVLYDLGMKK